MTTQDIIKQFQITAPLVLVIGLIAGLKGL